MLSCFSRVSSSVIPRAAAHQAPLSMGFSRPEYRSGFPFISPGTVLTQGSSPPLLQLPHRQACSFPRRTRGALGRPQRCGSASRSYPASHRDPVDRGTPGFLVLHHLLEFAHTHAHWIGGASQLSHPLLPSSPPALSINVFSNESAGQSVGASASASVLPMNIQLISSRIDRFDLAVQGTLKSLLQHHSSKASILQGSVFLMVQLSHPYMTTGKTTALTMGTFVSRAMPLLFNALSRLVRFFSKEQASFKRKAAVTPISVYF